MAARVSLVTTFLQTAAVAAMEALKSVIQKAARLKRDEGIVHLSSCFQWREFEGDDQRQYIHQEFVYENVMFSVQRGLPWAAVAQIANLSKELLPELRGVKRSEALSLIQTWLSQCDHLLTPYHHTTMYDFMVKTYIHHQCLYQAFLKKEVNRQCMHSHLEIHVPPHPLPLSEGTDLGVWEKHKSLKELMAAETVKLEEIHRLKEQAEAQILSKPQVRLSDLSLEDRLEKQTLKSMVRSFLQAEVEDVKEILIKEIRASQELLEIRLSQTALHGVGHSSVV